MQCTSITKAGTQCKNSALPNLNKCGIHHAVDDERRCSVILKRGTRCSKIRIEGNAHGECPLHATLRERALQQAADEFARLTIREMLLVRIQDMPHNRIDVIFAIERGVRLRRTTAWEYDHIVEHLIRLYFEPQHVEPPVAELGMIARDIQSVHTTVVSTQTNKGMDILFKIPVPEGQNTMTEIRTKWTSIFTGKPVQEIIYTDMQTWYNKAWCRDDGDYLYKRLLDHAWATIKSRPHEEQNTLCRRLQQECAEATGMCCDGHINRIVNAFVGFIDDIAPPVPVGEILQQKMAKISELEDIEDRVIQATALFDELGLNIEQAGPWLDAIA